MQFPDMTIYGTVVTQETQIRALKLFLQNQSRRAKDMVAFLEDVGVPVYVATQQGQLLISMRAADRLIQQAKKAGIITFTKGRWDNGPSAISFAT